jgi:hypothetical protein
MAESLSVLLQELEGSQGIHEMGESIHSCFDVKLPSTTGKQESPMKQRLPKNPRNVAIVQENGGPYSLSPQSWMTKDDSRPRSI